MSMTCIRFYYKIFYYILVYEGEFMLQEYRKRANITQEKLSELTGLDRKTIFRIENDLTIPRVDSYAKIVTSLDMTDKEIFNHLRHLVLNDEKKDK